MSELYFSILYCLRFLRKFKAKDYQYKTPMEFLEKILTEVTGNILLYIHTKFLVLYVLGF